MIRVALAGLGAVSRFYRRALAASPDFALAAVCDPDADRFAEEDVPRFADHRVLLRDAAPDAIVITTPNDLHAPMVTDALRAGVDVCCEKPLALAARDAEALAALAREQGRVLFTSFHRRYNEHVVRALANARPGDPVVEVECNYLERIEEHTLGSAWYFDAARSGGGCIADNGPNALDLVSRFIGDLSIESARVLQRRNGVDYEARIALRGAAGSATVNLSWQYDGERKDVIVTRRSGARETLDLLGGFTAFKSSLWHEYDGVLADFARRIRVRDLDDRSGVANVRLIERAYALVGDD